MVNKIILLFINILYPQSHLVKYLHSISYLTFISRLTPHPQLRLRMFHPFYYKDPFVKDCILELKERNVTKVADYFAYPLSQWIVRESITILQTNPLAQIFLLPVPQHKKRTQEKGFCHTTTLTNAIYQKIKIYNMPQISIKACIIKHAQTKKVHDTASKNGRLKILKNTMSAYITKQDSFNGYFFLIDDIYTTGATFKEIRRSLKDCAVFEDRIYYVSIAH